MISLPAGADRQSLAVGGRIKTSGELASATLSIYCEGAWEGFVDAPATREWMEFSRTMQIPAGASKARLQVTLKGEGKIWLDDLRLGMAKVWKD